MKTQTKTEDLQWQPLYQKLEFATLVYAGKGKEIVDRVNEQYTGTPAEIKDIETGKPITNSNTFKLYAIDSIARDLNARVMHPEESEFLFAKNRLPNQGEVYFVLAAVLDFSGRKHELAVLLYDQIPSKNLDKLPGIILGLKSVKSDIGQYSLAFEYTANSYLRHAPILNQKTGSFQTSDYELVKTGLPSKLGDGKRTLYTANQNEPSIDNLGLSGFYLGRDSVLVAGGEYLAGGVLDSRVVLVSTECASD